VAPLLSIDLQRQQRKGAARAPGQAGEPTARARQVTQVRMMSPSREKGLEADAGVLDGVCNPIQRLLVT
jgi:hypothetical protein